MDTLYIECFATDAPQSLGYLRGRSEQDRCHCLCITVSVSSPHPSTSESSSSLTQSHPQAPAEAAPTYYSPTERLTRSPLNPNTPRGTLASTPSSPPAPQPTSPDLHLTITVTMNHHGTPNLSIPSERKALGAHRRHGLRTHAPSYLVCPSPPDEASPSTSLRITLLPAPATCSSMTAPCPGELSFHPLAIPQPGSSSTPTYIHTHQRRIIRAATRHASWPPVR